MNERFERTWKLWQASFSWLIKDKLISVSKGNFQIIFNKDAF